jgi:hypothetical protein
MPPRVLCRNFLLLGLSLSLLCSLSCSSGQRKLYPVRGTVLCDGKPAEGAEVALYALDTSQPMQQVPRGRVQADGSFVIGTYVPADGAPAGDYKVIIVWLPPNAVDRVMETGSYPNLLPAIYSDMKTTPLTLQVKEGPNHVPAYELPGAPATGKGARR